jgi:hypothetical protein
MKHTRNDQAFVYYYSVSRLTGESRGLRFSRGTVASFRGQSPNPETIPVDSVTNLPIAPDDATGNIYDAIAEVIEQHPEVADLMSGRITIAEVV